MKVLTKKGLRDLMIANDELTFIMPLTASVIRMMSALAPVQGRQASVETLKDGMSGEHPQLTGYTLDDVPSGEHHDDAYEGRTIRQMIQDGTLDVLTYDEFEATL